MNMPWALTVVPGRVLTQLWIWRREVYTRFPRLDSKYLPIGHDTLVPFRGAVLGGIPYLHEPLTRYRRHPGQWQHVLHDHRARETWEESQYSAAIMPRLRMARDLEHLLSQADLPAGQRPRLAALQRTVSEHILLLAADIPLLGGAWRLAAEWSTGEPHAIGTR